MQLRVSTVFCNHVIMQSYMFITLYFQRNSETLKTKIDLTL